jgi:hypothetical protein
MKHSGRIDVYRVGLGRDLFHLRKAIRYGHPRGHLGRWGASRARLRWMVTSLHRRSWWGLWQAEWPGCKRAVRGFTKRGTLRKARKKVSA